MNRITKINVAILVITLFFPSCIKRSFEKERLDNYFDYLESADKFMGNAVISKNGIIIYSYSVGFSNIESKIETSSYSEYLTGSVSNIFTSVLIFKAVELGLINIEQTIHSFFPNIPNSEIITIANLMYHQSGLHDLFNSVDFFSWNTKPQTKEEMLNRIVKAGVDFYPGEISQYSNSNYILLTLILEEIFNAPYSKILKEYIKKPCDINNTYYYGKNDLKKYFCTSYLYVDSWEVALLTDTSIPHGACGIISTPLDLIKFSNALFKGELINSENLERIMTIKGDFGMGLIPIEFKGNIGFGHIGNIDGFSSMMFHFSNQNVSIALCSNAINHNINDIIHTMLLAAYKKPFDVSNNSLITLAP